MNPHTRLAVAALLAYEAGICYLVWFELHQDRGIVLILDAAWVLSVMAAVVPFIILTRYRQLRGEWS